MYAIMTTIIEDNIIPLCGSCNTNHSFGTACVVTDAKNIRIKPTAKYHETLPAAIDRVWEDQEGLHIHGVLSAPRMSFNGWIYFPEELAKQDGKTVPVYINHEEMFEENAKIRGTMNVNYNAQTWDLEYNALLTDLEAIDGVKNEKYKFTSMGAEWDSFDLIRGYQIPIGTRIVEGSLVDNPGVIGTSVITDSLILEHLEGKDRKLFSCTKTACDMLRSSIIKIDGNIKPIMTDKNREDLNIKAKELGIDVDSEEVKKLTDEELQKKIDEVITANEKKAIEEKDTKPKGDKAPQPVITVNVDTKAVAEEVAKVNKVFADFMVATGAPKPKGKILTNTDKESGRKRFYEIVTDSLKTHKELKWDYILSKLQNDNIAVDAIGLTEVGASAGAQWLEDLTVISGDFASGRIRDVADVVFIERGAKEVHFTLIATPVAADGTAPTVPADATQTITDILATPVERIVKQRVTDAAVRTTSVNLGAGIAQSFRIAEVVDEDDKFLTALNAVTVGNLAASLFGGTATSEATIVAGSTFDHKLLAKAKRSIARKGYAESYIRGALFCVMSPEQMEQLMGDTNIQRFVEWVAEGTALKDGFIPLLHGVELIVSSKAPIVDGSPTTLKVHRAYVGIKRLSCGLAFTKDLAIESVRYPEERATTIIGTWEMVAKVKKDDTLVRIATYGSGS